MFKYRESFQFKLANFVMMVLCIKDIYTMKGKEIEQLEKIRLKINDIELMFISKVKAFKDMQTVSINNIRMIFIENPSVSTANQLFCIFCK